MNEKVWRTLAIIFIILFVLETVLIIWVVSIANEDIKKENECIINTCGEYDVYYYDSDTQICECYKDRELIIQKFLG